MITSTYIWGLKKSGEIIGGNTSSITTKKHVSEEFEYFEKEGCIVGCIIQNSECGCLEHHPKYWWWGDMLLKDEFLNKIKAYLKERERRDEEEFYSMNSVKVPHPHR